MLWPLPGVVRDERLDEVIVDGRAVGTGHFSAVIAVEVKTLVRHHHGFLAAVALQKHMRKKKNIRRSELMGVIGKCGNMVDF